MKENDVKKTKQICLCAFVSTQLFTSYDLNLSVENSRIPFVIFHLKDKYYLGETDMCHIQNLKSALNAFSYFIDLKKNYVKYFLNEN